MALAEGPGELWPVSGSEAAECPDWRSLYERERERAAAAEARAEELRWAEVRARCEAGSWKSRWEASRRKLKKVIAETREARRAARNALALQSEVGRLDGLLREAGVDTGKRSTVMALRMEVERLRREGRALGKALDARGAEVRSLHRARNEADAALRKALRGSRRRKATIGELRRDKARRGRKVRALRRRIERLEGRLAELRSSRTVLPKGKSGGACERRERPRSKRRRGQQPGAAGPRPHGAAWTRGAHRGAQPAVRCAGVPGLREPVRGQRCRRSPRLSRSRSGRTGG